jgi:hypothetical protein
VKTWQESLGYLPFQLHDFPKVTHVPSARRDSGTTLSRVRGSTAIPEVVVFGTMSGFDMAEVKCSMSCVVTSNEIFQWRCVKSHSCFILDMITSLRIFLLCNNEYESIIASIQADWSN